MTDDQLVIVALLLAAIPWGWAAVRAIRQDLDVITLAFLLILFAAITGGIFGRAGFAYGSGFAFLVAGVVLLVFWPKKAP